MIEPAGQRRIAILGAGFSGLCLAIRLKQAGIEAFTIYEKADTIGGTWRDNSYPGACCDVPSFAYCFSFEQKTDWSRVFSPQEEIRDYMEHCVRRYGLARHLRLGTEIARARFDETAALWRMETTAGEPIEAEIVVSGVGQLNRPHVPRLPGLERFEGAVFHSARWDHSVDLAGRDVAVIGNAASAIQFIPRIAPAVRRLAIFQRSANWLLPRNDRAYTEAEKRRFARWPGLARAYRWLIWALLEARFPVFLGNRLLGGATRKAALRYIDDAIADPALRRHLVPDYPVGGKRILVSDDYYPALNRPNVDLVTEGIAEVAADGLVAADGSLHRADVIVFATGFESTSFLAPMRIEGRGGRSLDEAWSGGASAYLGIGIAGFPNLFLMYGPNTNLGHNSIIFMIECQAGYILQAIRAMADGDLASIEPRAEVVDAFDRRTQTELARTVWSRTPRSWYKTAAGRITNNWSGTTTRYWLATRRFDPADYVARRRGEVAHGAPGPGSPGDRAEPAAA